MSRFTVLNSEQVSFITGLNIKNIIVIDKGKIKNFEEGKCSYEPSFFYMDFCFEIEVHSDCPCKSNRNGDYNTYKNIFFGVISVHCQGL